MGSHDIRAREDADGCLLAPQNTSLAPKRIEHEDDSVSRLAPAIPFMVRADRARTGFHRTDEATRDGSGGLHGRRRLVHRPGDVDPLLGAVSIIAIAAGAGAAGVLNMWYDADIDAVMTRTARRPIPDGKVSRAEALGFGLVLACGAVAVLALALNVAAAALLAFAIFFYIAVYTIWLKRRTPQNIVIGGAAGALPPVIGWAAATGAIGLEPLILFLIIFLWTPPHFWALSLTRTDDYARAGVPMLPVVGGSATTAWQILAYSVLLVPTSVLPCVLGFAGTIYGATAVVSGARLHRARCPAEQEPRGRSASRASPVRLLHFLSLPVVCGPLGRPPDRSLVNDGRSVWRSD